MSPTTREAAERAAREAADVASGAVVNYAAGYLRGHAEGRAPLLAALREIHRAYIASESTAMGEAIEAAAALADEPATHDEVDDGSCEAAHGENFAGMCTKCGGDVYHRPGKPGEYDHECDPRPHRINAALADEPAKETP